MASNKGYQNLNLVIAKIIILFPLTSSVGRLIPFSLNQIMVLLLITIIILKQIKLGKLHKKSILIIGYLLFFTLNGLLLTTDIRLNIENCTYWITTILILMYMRYSENRVYLKNSYMRLQSWIKMSTVVTIFINCLGLLNSTNYEATGAYIGYMVTSHSMASTMILAITNLLFYKKNIFHIVALLFLTVILFFSEARTFMVPLAVILYFELRQWVPNKNKRKMIICIGVIILIIVFPYTSMAKKFIETLENPYARNRLSGITNFRSTLWEADIAQFMAENIYYKLFGNGFSYSYQLHDKLFGVKIWSHNDFFNLLIATGFLGMSGYIYILIDLLYKLHNYHKNKFYTFLFFIMIFVTAFFNGFYLYISVVFAFILISINNNIMMEGKKKNENRNYNNSCSI